MNDDQLPDLLRRLQPAGPRPELRARIVESATPRRVWPWAVAAAALLALVTGLQVSASSVRRDMRASITVAGPEEPSELDVLRDTFGFDENTLRAVSLRQRLEALRSPESPEEQRSK
jgi:hypothetical protein